MTRTADGDQRAGIMYGVAMLISGTFATVIMKAEYSIVSRGTEPCVDSSADATTYTLDCPFDKPWFGVLQMKLAMSLCLVFLYLRKVVKHQDYLETPLLRLRKGGKKYMATPEVAQMKRRTLGDAAAARMGNSASARETTALLEASEAQKGKVSLKTMAAISVPSFLDLLQTVFANVGLLWISSSVFQMARGSVIIFSAIFSVRLMNKRLYAYHHISILIVAISVVLVGWAGVGHGDIKTGEMSAAAAAAAAANSKNELLGLIFIIGSQVLCALQIVVEEHLMVALNVSPMLLVGLEGLWGLFFYVILVPILSLTPPGTTPFAKIWHEDFYDSIVKISHSPTLVVLIVLYVIAVGTLNVTANYVTKHLSAVMRSIVETLRTLGVWMLGLFVYYALRWQGVNSPGEQWTVYSWLELLGFVLMVYGTLAYKKIWTIPIHALYSTEERDHAAEAYKSPFMSGMHK